MMYWPPFPADSASFDLSLNPLLTSWVWTCCTIRLMATWFSPPRGTMMSAYVIVVAMNLSNHHHYHHHPHHHEPVVGGLDVVLVLLQHPVDVSAPVRDVALESPRQPHVRVRVDKHLLESTNVNGVKTTCCLFTIVNNISSASSDETQPHLHVQHVADGLVVEGEDALEYDNIGTVHRNCLGFSSVCNKIVNRNVNLLHLLQSLKRVSQKLKVKGLRGVKVVLK